MARQAVDDWRPQFPFPLCLMIERLYLHDLKPVLSTLSQDIEGGGKANRQDTSVPSLQLLLPMG